MNLAAQHVPPGGSSAFAPVLPAIGDTEIIRSVVASSRKRHAVVYVMFVGVVFPAAALIPCDRFSLVPGADVPAPGSGQQSRNDSARDAGGDHLGGWQPVLEDPKSYGGNNAVEDQPFQFERYCVAPGEDPKRDGANDRTNQKCASIKHDGRLHGGVLRL